MREQFRYTKNGRSRVYSLREVAQGVAELWVEADQRGRPVKARKLVMLEKPEDIDPVLDDVERELRIGGWAKV